MKTGPGFNAYVPPSRFKPVNASNSVLAEMNLPTRPSGGSALAAWKKDMGAYKGTDKPDLCESETVIAPPVGKLTPLPGGHGTEATHYGSQYWSGYVDNAGGYTEVAAHWTQQGTFACGCQGPTNAVTWVGIGGVSQGLLQDGTDNYSNMNPYSWFEYLNNPGVGIQQEPPTTIGDDIAAAVSYSNGTATFGLTDNGVYKFNISVGGWPATMVQTPLSSSSNVLRPAKIASLR